MAAAHSDWELRFHDEVRTQTCGVSLLARLLILDSRSVLQVWPSGTSWDAFVATVRMVVLNTNRVSNVAAHKRWRGELQDWQDEVTAAALESRYYKLPWEEQEEDIEAVKRFDSQLKAMGRRGQLPFVRFTDSEEFRRVLTLGTPAPTTRTAVFAHSTPGS